MSVVPAEEHIPEAARWDVVRAFTPLGIQLRQPLLHLLHRDNAITRNFVRPLCVILLLQECEVRAHRVQELIYPVGKVF